MHGEPEFDDRSRRADAERAEIGIAVTTPAPPTSPTQLAEEQTKRFTEAVEKVRGRADTSAKAFAALSTAGLSAAGLTKITDLLPLPHDRGVAAIGVALAICGFAAMAVALLLFTRTQWRVNRPIFTTSNPNEMTDLDSTAEIEIVNKAYKQTAELNGVTSGLLHDYEQQGLKLDGDAQGLADPTLKAAMQADANRIRAEVREAQARAVALIVKERSASAFSGPGVWGSALLLLVGILAFGGGTDLLSAERDDAKISFAKNCADAREAISGVSSDLDLPSACGGITSSSGSTPAASRTDRERASSVAALSKQYETCLAQSRNPIADCGPTQALIQQLTNG